MPHTPRLLAALALALLLGACHATETPARCTLCDKAIPAGAGVVAQVGSGSIQPYRCIHCALTDLKQESDEILLTATTPLDGQQVRLTRSHGVWTSEPASTVFLILPERADECLDVHQPFADRDEFDRYLAEHPELAAEGPEAFTIAQYEQILLAGLPQDGGD